MQPRQLHRCSVRSWLSTQGVRAAPPESRLRWGSRGGPQPGVGREGNLNLESREGSFPKESPVGHPELQSPPERLRAAGTPIGLIRPASRRGLV